MSRAPKVIAAFLVAIVISACGARGVEPAGDGATPTSPVTIAVTSTTATTSTTTVVEAPAMGASEVDQIQADLAEIERLVTELEELLAEPVTR